MGAPYSWRVRPRLKWERSSSARRTFVDECGPRTAHPQLRGNDGEPRRRFAMAHAESRTMEAATSPAGPAAPCALAGRSKVRSLGRVSNPLRRSLIDMIRLFQPTISEHAVLQAEACLRSGWVSEGTIVAAFEDEFCRHFGFRNALALNSGTAALHSPCWAPESVRVTSYNYRPDIRCHRHGHTLRGRAAGFR